MQALIDSLRHGVPTALIELHRLGRTLSRRAADVLAYFDRPGTMPGLAARWSGRSAGCDGLKRPGGIRAQGV